jgi:hypothetical protein
MPIVTPTTENLRAVVLPEYLQLLLGCLFLALFLCIPIVAYTNHLKNAAETIAPVYSAEASAAEPIAPRNIRGPETLQESGPIAQSTQNQPAVAVSSRTSRPIRAGGDQLSTLIKMRTSARNVHKLAPTARSRSAAPNVSKAWSRANSSRHDRAELIALWRQTLRRSSKRQNRVVSLLGRS